MKLTIGEFLKKRLASAPSTNAVGRIEQGQVKFYSIEEYYQEIEHIAIGLGLIGMSAATKVAILSLTRIEWHLVDMATVCSGGIVIPIYPTYLPSDIEYILNHAEASILVVEDKDQLTKIYELQENIKTVKNIICINRNFDLNSFKFNNIKIYSLSDIIQKGREEHGVMQNYLSEKIDSLRPADIATIIYTSGTTGEPKGTIITHEAFSTMLQNIGSFLKGGITAKDRLLTFLPLSHVFGRCDSMIHLVFNLEDVYAESIDKIIDNLGIAKPSIMLAVPRIFEKVYSKIMDQISSGSFIKKSIFHWAKGVSDQYFEYLEKDQTPPMSLITKRKLAYKLVFSKIYQRFGGNVRFFVSGGAPLSVTIIRFLRNANLNILEGYGLTETVAPCTLNPVYKQIPGTVGLPTGDVELKIAEDGEILVKSKALFSNYYKNPEATAEVLANGWFKTGDIGEITPEGYLKITDRKKDIIITSGGKNVAPQKIENMLKTKKNISHAMIIGDKMKYLTCVIGVEKERFKNSLDKMGLSANCTIKEIAQHEFTKKLIQSDIDKVNKNLSSFETIKKFYIAPVEFSVDGGELTPSLKLKKKILFERYKTEIDAMQES